MNITPQQIAVEYHPFHRFRIPSNIGIDRLYNLLNEHPEYVVKNEIHHIKDYTIACNYLLSEYFRKEMRDNIIQELVNNNGSTTICRRIGLDVYVIMLASNDKYLISEMHC